MVEMPLERANREFEDSRSVIKKSKGEVERLGKRYHGREEEWGKKKHEDLEKRGSY